MKVPAVRSAAVWRHECRRRRERRDYSLALVDLADAQCSRQSRMAAGLTPVVAAVSYEICVAVGQPRFWRNPRNSDDARPDRTRPGQRVLEIGPGPGRLLIPAARRVLPGGEAIGIDIQKGMLDRLNRRARQKGITNLSTIHGDATQAHVPAESCDVVMLCEVLGEIPDRAAVLAQCFRALKRDGVLSITEQFGDPHYQFLPTLKRLAGQAGFQLQAIQGGWWLYTANFVKR